MNIHDTEIVPDIRASLQRTMGAERYELWFGSRIRLAQGEGKLCLLATNRFYLELVQKNFRQDIESAVACVSPSLAIEYSVEPTPSDRSRASATSPPEPFLTEHSSHPRSANASATPGICDLDEQSPDEQSPDEQSTEGSDASLSADQDPARRVGVIKANDSQPNTTGRKMQASHATRRRFARIETLIVGPCNELALTSARMVLESPGRLSPLFLHGPPGTGKSHMIEGVWTRFRQQYPRRRAVYLSAEQFTTLFLAALHGKGLPNFRNRYRDVDLLILDDIQFFGGKQATIVEVVHTLDSLARKGQQVLVAADRPIAQLVHLGPELCARLTGGVSCRIDPLHCDVRRQLIRQGALDRCLELPDDAVSLLSEQVEGDGRQIRGVLNVLWTHQQTHGAPLATVAIQRVLDELYGDRVRLVQLSEIERIVCELCGLDRRALHTAGRIQQLTNPRMLAMWLARRYTPAGLTEISQHFGRRSHTTVLSAEKRVNAWLEEGAQVRLGAEMLRIRDVVRKAEQRLRAG